MPAALEPSDRDLADQVRLAGEEHAFRALYRRHTPALYRFALRLLGGDELEADDAVQETWIKALEGLPGFRWEASLRTWLTGIALNICRGILRRRDRHWLEVTDEREPAVAGLPVGESLDLEAGLARLPAGYRAVVVLHDVEGYTHEEIAARLQIAVNTSKSQLSRGRRRLRRLLTAGEGQAEGVDT